MGLAALVHKNLLAMKTTAATVVSLCPYSPTGEPNGTEDNDVEEKEQQIN